MPINEKNDYVKDEAIRLYEEKSIIGRKPECAVNLTAKSVSGRHATISFEGD